MTNRTRIFPTTGARAATFEATGGTLGSVLASRFTAFARVNGVRLVDVTTGPGEAVNGHVQLASQPLHMRYLKEGQTIDAKLSPVPSDVTVSFDPTAGKLDYNANAGIDSIEATLDATAPLFGRVKHLAARVENLPSVVSVGFKPASGSGRTCRRRSASSSRAQRRSTAPPARCRR